MRHAVIPELNTQHPLDFLVSIAVFYPILCNALNPLHCNHTIHNRAKQALTKVIADFAVV